MWKDLTLQQKAEIMKMSVANGVTDINDIRKLYNESIHADGGHLYQNGGRPNWSHDPASMIEHFEGFRESPYRDGTAWSVGYGQYMKGYGANLDWNALLSGRKKLSRSEAHQQVLRTVEDLKRQLRRALGDKLYNSLTPGQLMGYLDTGYQRPASMIQAAQVHRTKGAEAAASVLGVNGFADRNAARRAAFTGDWNNYKPIGNANQHIPNMSTGADYNRQMLNNLESPAFQPIALNSPNTSSVWMDYVSKIGQQSPLTFNTPIGINSVLANNNSINLEPVDFSVIRNSDPLSLDSYASKNNVEYGLGLEGNALWNSPYVLFNEHSAANGGHLFYPGGEMLLKDNAVNPLMQYVYGPEYRDIVIANRNYRPRTRRKVTRPNYNLEQRADVVRNTAEPTRKKIAQKQVDSPARRDREQQRYDAMMEQYRKERQGTISQAPDRLRHPDYDPVKANQVQQRYEQNEIAERSWFNVNKRALEHNTLEAMEAIPWPSTIAGSLFNPNTHWYDPGSFFTNLYANDNRGFFNFNQATRDWYDKHPEIGSIANLAGDFIVPGAAAKALKGIGKIPEVSRNLVASSAINYGAKTRTLPINIYKQRRMFNIGDGMHIWDNDPFVEFINSKRGIPSNTSYFFRMPNNVDILKARNGAYRAKGNDYVIHSGGTVDGKFVSYGEPWMEFGTGQNSAWYEFPTMRHRGPHRMATDWRGNVMDYTTQEAYDQMAIRRNPEFIRENKEFIFKDFNSREEALQAQKDFNEEWGIDPSVNVYDIYHSNQTVIPNKEWNFNSEYPRGFLSQPFWRYTQDPYSGAVQKELMMNWESPMKALDKTHADIIPFLDETGKWDYLTSDVHISPDYGKFSFIGDKKFDTKFCRKLYNWNY